MSFSLLLSGGQITWDLMLHVGAILPEFSLVGWYRWEYFLCIFLGFSILEVMVQNLTEVTRNETTL